MNIIHTCTLSYGNIVHDNHQSSTSPHELHMHKHLHMLYDCLAYRCLLSKLMYEHSYYHQLYPIVSCLVNKGCLCVYQKACYELSRPQTLRLAMSGILCTVTVAESTTTMYL